MLTPTGCVTDAYLMLPMGHHWTSYYQWWQKGQWSWLALVRQCLRWVLATTVQCGVVHVAIDDTWTLRASKQAPGSKLHHQHGNKPQLAKFVQGQCWSLIRSVYRLFKGLKVRVLVDSGYMHRCFIQSMQTRGLDVIGQASINTRLNVLLM